MNILNHEKYSKWFITAFLAFIIAGILGAIMRFAFVGNLPEWINYLNIMHAHSHLAMLGWLFGALYIFIIGFFQLERKVYIRLFWLSMLMVLGMLISFVIQGYGLVAVSFTSIHLLLGYFFIYFSIKDLAKQKQHKKDIASLFVITGLLFLFVSSLGTWMLAYLMKSGMKGSALYYGSIQFYLHFQFNGWFIFTALGLFFKLLNKFEFTFDYKQALNFYRLLLISCVLTYALAVTWSTPDNIIFWTNSAGVLIQFIAILFFLKILKRCGTELNKGLKKWTFFLWKIAAICFAFKIVIQVLVAIPYLATMSYTIKNFVIGFIHLLMLGAISNFILGVVHEIYNLSQTLFRRGIKLFLFGFFASEVLLFLQGILLWAGIGFIPFYYLGLFIVSACMPLGVILILSSLIKSKRQALQTTGEF